MRGRWVSQTRDDALEFRRSLIKWAAYAALVGLVAGAAGLLSQAVIVSTGGQESAALVAASGTLAGGSLTTLGGLAGLVWARAGNGK